MSGTGDHAISRIKGRPSIHDRPFRPLAYTEASSSRDEKKKETKTGLWIEKKERSSRLLWFLGLVGVIVTVASALEQRIIMYEAVYDELIDQIRNEIDQIRNEYRIHDDAVHKIQTGIAKIFEREDTGSFMFVYNSTDDNFNEREFDTFVRKVSNAASKFLRKGIAPRHYTLVEAAALNIYGPTEMISTFRGELDRTGVMLVKHVEAIPSYMSFAFFHYCDADHPIVKKSAIFFTLNLAKCPLEMEKKSTHATVEKCLAQRWSISVPSDHIGPLLSWVVSGVMDFTNPL